MMIKNECDIVKDLFPNYIENQVNEGTKEFVDKHLKECANCSKLLNSIIQENDEEMYSEKKEIDFFKIYNLQLIIARVIIVFLLCIIIPNGGILGYRLAKGSKAYNILQEAYAKKEELLSKDNFAIEMIDNNKEVMKISVYNEYFKEEIKHNENLGFKDYTNYCRSNENNETLNITALTNEKIISSVSISTRKFDKTQYDVIFSDLNSISTRNKMNCYNIKVSEEKFKNIDCYVLEEANKYCISRWYIDRNNMLIVRFEKYGLDGELQRFQDYNYSIDTVKKEEVIITERDGKLIANGLDEYEFNDSVWSRNIMNEYLK